MPKGKGYGVREQRRFLVSVCLLLPLSLPSLFVLRFCDIMFVSDGTEGRGERREGWRGLDQSIPEPGNSLKYFVFHSSCSGSCDVYDRAHMAEKIVSRKVQVVHRE